MKNQKKIAAIQLEKYLTEKRSEDFKYDRRVFVAFSSFFLLRAVSSYSSEEGISELESVIFTEEFQFLFDVAFPSTQLKLDALRQPAIERITHLDYESATSIINLLDRFSIEMQKTKSKKGQKHSIQEGEKYLANIIRDNPDIANQGLDIIYREISKVKYFREALWDRKISLHDRKCAYWENYDAKPSS